MIANITTLITIYVGTHIGYRTKIVDGIGSVSYRNVGIDWCLPDEAHMSPDVSIIHNVQNPRKKRDIFNVAEEDTAPSLVTEITSSTTRSADFHQSSISMNAEGSHTTSL